MQSTDTGAAPHINKQTSSSHLDPSTPHHALGLQAGLWAYCASRTRSLMAMGGSKRCSSLMPSLQQ